MIRAEGPHATADTGKPRDYLETTEEAATSRGQLELHRPFDWDHGSAVKSYAAGAAHVYTVEQSP
jgi:hypothetical protein